MASLSFPCIALSSYLSSISSFNFFISPAIIKDDDSQQRIFNIVTNIITNQKSEFVEKLNHVKAKDAQILRVKGVLRDAQGQFWRIESTEHASEFYRLDTFSAEPVVVLIGRHLPDDINL
jgi:hypothetical protein